MDIVKEIESITSNRGVLSDSDIVDALLILDAKNVDLGCNYTLSEKKRMKSNSKKIIKAIKEFDEQTYITLSKGIDKF